MHLLFSSHRIDQCGATFFVHRKHIVWRIAPKGQFIEVEHIYEKKMVAIVCKNDRCEAYQILFSKKKTLHFEKFE